MSEHCRFCGKEFETKEELERHINNAQIKDVLEIFEEHWK